MDITARFATVVAVPSSDVPLDEAALLVAARARPATDVAAALARLDAIARACVEPTFDGVRAHLFEGERFRGNVDDYGDPRNSMLDAVLERRLGIPITLSLVMIEVGRRLGVRIVPVGMPGHFLVRDGADASRFCDPFAGGAVLDADGCREVFDRVHRGARAFHLSMLAPISAHSVLSRILANLERGALARDLDELAWMVELHVSIPGLRPEERIALVPLLERLGRIREAMAVLDDVVARAPSHDASRLADYARSVRARLN